MVEGVRRSVAGRTGLALVPLALFAACATGLREPKVLVEVDLDGDTRVDRIETIENGRVARVVEAPSPGSKPKRTVVIAIDAVPYAVFARLQRQGLFREFFPAARMIAPFPSLTNVGYAAILKTAPVLGFEDLYYDPVENVVGGGVGAGEVGVCLFFVRAALRGRLSTGQPHRVAPTSNHPLTERL